MHRSVLGTVLGTIRGTDRGTTCGVVAGRRLAAAVCAAPLALSSLAILAVTTAGCGGGDDAPRVLVVPAPQAQVAPGAPAPASASAPKSVVFLIVDGMGPQQMGLLFDWASAAGKSPTQLERLGNEGTVGLVRTGAHDSPLTDSASSATTLATGVQTLNGAIGVGPDGKRLTTCLEDAVRTGRKTGLVTSTRITHATPASFAAHVPSRREEPEIARQLIEESSVNVMLGGGSRFFEMQVHGGGVSLMETAREKGFAVVTDEASLAKVPVDTDRLLGLFSGSHLPYLLDRDAPGEIDCPSLTTLTSKALEMLGTSETGFFLMIEGGRVDHAGHGNDVAGVLGEMRELDETLGVVLEYQKAHPDVLVVVTADHETGGLAVTGAYDRWLSDQDFLNMAAATNTIEGLARKGQMPQLPRGDHGIGRKRFYPQTTRPMTAIAIQRSATWNVAYASQTHTTTPVMALAIGPGEEEFAGIYRNGRIGKLLRGWMSRESGE